MAYFVDTSYFVALVILSDAHHDAAIKWQETAEGGFVTTDYVLIERMNALSYHKRRATAAALVAEVRRATEFAVVPASKTLMDSGVDLYRSRPDKDWSLTDCISFVVMQEQDLTDALSSDHHFEQAGFKALLRQGK